MIAPHSRQFQFRRTIFWSFSAAALVLGAHTAALSGRRLVLAVLAAAALAGVLYLYARWLAGIESRFKSVHPRKYRLTMLLMFYGCSAAAFLLVALTPWLDRWWVSSPLGSATGYLIAPALLASAAGFIHHWTDGEPGA